MNGTGQSTDPTRPIHRPNVTNNVTTRKLTMTLKSFRVCERTIYNDVTSITGIDVCVQCEQ